jgi:omega-amidase
MEALKITTVQTFLHWETSIENLAHFTKKINSIQHPTDVIVLPEMFTTGFTMNPSVLAEEHGGIGLQWMIQTAKEKKCAITGSISVKEVSNYYNRLYWVNPDGTYLHYDKRHLFRMGNEQLHYASGTNKLIIEYKGWKICPLVCYDLRFPVWSRNTKDNTYDVLLYVANWPQVRNYPWKQLLIARAIENQCYVVGVNRIGEDGNAIAHSGDSCVINPRGEKTSHTLPDEDKIETTELSYQYLTEYRNVFPVIEDADEFAIR